MVFDSAFDALVCFFYLCDIDVRRGSPSAYGEVDTSPPPIMIDNTVTNITNVVTSNTYQEGDSVETSFPSYYTTNNYYNYDDYRQHPEYIFDFNQDDLLNSDFNMPAYDGNKFATKFPFCIPFDIIHFLAVFSLNLMTLPNFILLFFLLIVSGLQNVSYAEYNQGTGGQWLSGNHHVPSQQ